MLSAMSQLRLLGAAANSNTAPVIGAADSDYKALVCLFMSGGNDNDNLIIPNDSAGYAAYAKARSNLALPQANLLGINPATTDGRAWALHPSLSKLGGLFGSGQVALMANVGTLVVPTTRAQFLAQSVPLPAQLFSHADQALQWQTSVPDKLSQTGWGGRLADLTNAFNENNKVSMAISLAGNNLFQVGDQITQLSVSETGAPTLAWHEDKADDLASMRVGAMRAMFKDGDPNLFRSAFGQTSERALENSDLLGAALQSVPAPKTAFPTTPLGQQMQMIAHLIGARSQLGLKRQVFFAEIEGFDMHDVLIGAHARLLTEISDAMKAFYDETVALGLQDNVTTFTASDFGRTHVSNGNGSDHGWGGHHIIMGGAVRGGDIYGTMPNLTVDGPDDTDHGRWIPTTSVDEYAATLARWFGVSDTDLPVVFPNIGNFRRRDVGFMGV
ncbi:MAG: DUF1501 domain-containing protein [Synoicihabitans sp.]